MEDFLLLLKNMLVFSLCFAPNAADTSECMRFCDKHRDPGNGNAYEQHCHGHDEVFDHNWCNSNRCETCPESCINSPWYSKFGNKINCPEGKAPPLPPPPPEHEERETDASDCLQFCNENRRAGTHNEFILLCNNPLPFVTVVKCFQDDFASVWYPCVRCPEACLRSGWHKPKETNKLKCPEGPTPAPTPEPTTENSRKTAVIVIIVAVVVVVLVCCIGGICACVYCSRRRNRNMYMNPTNAQITPQVGYGPTMNYPRQAMIQIQPPLMQPQYPISQPLTLTVPQSPHNTSTA